MGTDMLKAAFDAYRDKAEGSLAERLRFLEGLSAIQAEIAAADRPYTLPDADAAREAIATGQPVFLSAPPSLPRDEFVTAARRIAAYVADEAGLGEAQAAALRDAGFDAAITRESLDAVIGDTDAFVAQVSAALGAADDAAIKPATVAFVLLSTLVGFCSPAAEAALESIGEFGNDARVLGACPVCGSPATLGIVGEVTKLKGGDRTLWCGLCHTRWPYDRLQCVRCGSRVTDKLRYTHIEDDAAHRLHLCDECHGYIRVVFTGELDVPFSPFVEDAVGARLDAIATRAGYTASGNGGVAH